MINETIFNNVVSEAKAKAGKDAKWLRAIERAAKEILSGEMLVTICGEKALVTTAGGQYWVNGVCGCRAAQHGHTQCAHRAAKKLMANYEEAACKAAFPAEFKHDVLTSSRENLIIEIENVWPRVAPTTPLAVALMSRFGVNSLNFLDIELLRAVRLAIAA